MFMLYIATIYLINIYHTNKTRDLVKMSHLSHSHEWEKKSQNWIIRIRNFDLSHKYFQISPEDALIYFAYKTPNVCQNEPIC